MTELGSDPDVGALAVAHRKEALAMNQRRLLVLAGDRDAGIDVAFDVIRGADVPDDEMTFAIAHEGFRFHHVRPKHASSSLGATRTLVVFDTHERSSVNVLGRVAGAVNGGGLFVLLAPSFDG